MPTMPSYSLSSNNIQANPACLQSSNASSYSCMIPGNAPTLPAKKRAKYFHSCLALYVSSVLKKSVVFLFLVFFLEYAPRSYDPLSLSNYPRPSCNPAAGMQSHMTHNNHASAASTGEQIYFSSY